ncbi:MAG: gliding motility-associated C-terminal domain-containing protein, partial [Algoriphagus sp.]|nr:gliding motility-associated C-terminal domain-containing protein [Algoriphagus sp.]
SSGKLLVRTALTPEQEAAADNNETFTLTATNTGGTAAVGTGTIKDDGTGTIFNADGTENTTATKDDDRPLAVNSITVNEGSPFAVFEVSGAAGQLTSLALANGTTTGLTGLEYYNGTAWVAYTSGTVALNSSGKLLVRTALTPEQEAAADNGETFTLTATNTGGTAAVGIGTIKDDGTGDYWAANNNTATPAVPAGVKLDDDRPLTVNSITVNEGSPYGVFEVSGAAGQLTTLALANGTTTGLTGLEYYNGTAWVAYTTGTVALNSSGKLLVRTALTPEQEAAADNGETFTLTATNTGGTAAVGTGTVKDDGTGTIFNADGTENTTATKDDDRALAVNSITVNEGSPFAVFEVSGAAGQLTSLALANSTTTGLTGLEYFNGTAWVAYTSGTVALNSSGKLLVRTALTPEQEAAADNGETFTLTATNTGGTAAVGTGTIKDDGTGDYWAANNNTATPALPAGTTLDDDRPLTVNSITVNEGSPYAVFEVSGAAGQLTSLALANGTTTGLTGLEYFNGTAWVAYTSGTVALNSSGQLLVRTALSPEQEATPDNGETFTLTATNTGGTAAVGTGTIKDDGTGTIFNEDGTENTTAIKDNDRVFPQPDFNATYLGIPLTGTIATNDDVPVGSTYGEPVPNTTNPAGATIEMNPDGSYTFTASIPGVYSYTVPVCNATGSCVETTLTITVKDPAEPAAPILNTDLGTVRAGDPVRISTLNNDKPGRPGVSLNPASVAITVAPSNGVVTVDPVTGVITYTPNAGFVGKDVYTYQVCDTGNPALCATAIQEITVVGPSAPNAIVAADDFTTGPAGTKLLGNVVGNDGDLDGQPLVVTPQETQTPSGTLKLNADGSYEFVPAPGFVGPVQFVYEVCTGGSQPVCTKATLYLLVAPNDLEAIMDNFKANEINGLAGGTAGNVLTNDLFNGAPVKPADVVVAVKNNGGIVGLTIDANGNLIVPKGTAPGSYVITYTICDKFLPTNCSEAIAMVEVFHGVNLRITKSAISPSKFEGDQLEFLIRVENNGTTDASAVVVTDRLDAGFSYVSSTITGATAATSVSGQEVKWTFASLPAGRIAEITVRVKANPLAGGQEKLVANTATVSSPARELSPNDNSSTTSVAIKPFFLSNVITPNGDGKNDAFVINGLGRFASNEIVIFDRWGSHVFQKKGYQNDWAGQGLVAGTYFYILSVVDSNGEATEFKGWIQLIRE